MVSIVAVAGPVVEEGVEEIGTIIEAEVFIRKNGIRLDLEVALVSGSWQGHSVMREIATSDKTDWTTNPRESEKTKNGMIDLGENHLLSVRIQEILSEEHQPL